jgi:hypothetical protein
MVHRFHVLARSAARRTEVSLYEGTVAARRSAGRAAAGVQGAYRNIQRTVWGQVVEHLRAPFAILFGQ